MFSNFDQKTNEKFNVNSTNLHEPRLHDPYDQNAHDYNKTRTSGARVLHNGIISTERNVIMTKLKVTCDHNQASHSRQLTLKKVPKSK